MGIKVVRRGRVRPALHVAQGDELARRIASVVEPFAFEAIYGAWWGTVIRRGGPDVVRRSARRYERALRGELL